MTETTYTPGDRVLFLDREAEFDRTWSGTITLDRGDGSYSVKLDAGLTWRCLARDLRPIHDEREDDE